MKREDSIETRRNIIELKGMEFHAYHGCLEKEKRDGNKFLVDFWAELAENMSFDSDRIEDAIDFGDIYKLIQEQMLIPSNLLEHLCKRIVKRIEEEFTTIPLFYIKVSKINPPVENATIACSSVTVYGGYEK